MLNFNPIIYNNIIVFLQELSKVQDNEVGDGTTSVTVLACELLRVCMHSLNTHSSRINLLDLS